MLTLKMLFIFCCLFSVRAAAATPKRNSTALIPQASVTDPAAIAQFPPNILFADTGIAARYVLLFGIGGWDIFTVCDLDGPSVNFFGGYERLPKDVCASPDTQGELVAYSFVRATEMEFPEPSRNYAQVMRDNGYDPEDRSTDVSTAVGMGNIIGMRLAEWMGKDGWNSRGDLTREKFRKPFEDYTGYRPVNTAHELKYPLRWQPLVDADPKFGRFTVQEHVIPFLGYVKPLLMSHEELVSRYVGLPYLNINDTQLSGKDAENIDMLVRELVQASAASTPMQRALAKWFDNKFVSTGIFLAAYMNLLDLDEKFVARWTLGETMAQHDAMLLAWKEKRRIDAVRPKSIIHNFYGDEEFQVFVSPEVGVASVKGKDWEPLVVTQPHSEYPSASAALCTAFADHASLMLKEHLEANGLSEEPEITLQAFAISEGISEFTFKSVKDAGSACGESRVWAGVHFPPSIPAGEMLVDGVGQEAYNFVTELSEGKIPSSCWWCGEFI